MGYFLHGPFECKFQPVCRRMETGHYGCFRDREFQVFCLIVLVSALLMTANLVGMGLERGEAFRQALFQAASISSSTGFVSADFDQWPSFCKAILLFLMFCGGCAGSTAGGLKTTRLILLFKSLHLVVKQRYCRTASWPSAPMEKSTGKIS